MSEKNRQRAALTKQLLYGAFLRLLREKEIHQISIRELCQEAGINRTTFYHHFGSQYDVLAEMEDKYLDEIARTIENADVEDKESVLRRVTLVLQFIQDNEELSARLLHSNIDERFAKRLFSLPKIEEMLDRSLAGLPPGREKESTVSFVIYGSYKVLQDWINDPERVSPAAEAALILRLARKACS